MSKKLKKAPRIRPELLKLCKHGLLMITCADCTEIEKQLAELKKAKGA